ncbi:MAG: hypothetical protein A3F70_12560 [Acidobacteria bacterium RIFCSPLOWO2_12_FULL_67_14]|nr:MAG: hypothetical protein A3H29_00760 [Acidobacteria bacterium RIFCSPLOWO2_02_FULL_67_21]OFW37244.1 MAG: hypothetical protein A3F70_12560 [Acidobacteria bacterium RIFCSPLOWO2_12_FULL_67_14]
MRRPVPLSQRWGFDRGSPVDRYYVEQFLARQGSDIRGRVLEVKDSGYIRRFGHGVTRADVIDIDSTNRQATIIGDLAHPDSLEPDAYDCCVVVQTLHHVLHPRSAVHTLYRALRPGGVLLVTLPSITRVDPDVPDTDYWRFTPAVCRRLFGECFGEECIQVDGLGNVLTSIAFLAGMAQEELSRDELDRHDAAFPVIVSVRAVKVADSKRES